MNIGAKQPCPVCGQTMEPWGLAGTLRCPRCDMLRGTPSPKIEVVELPMGQIIKPAPIVEYHMTNEYFRLNIPVDAAGQVNRDTVAAMLGLWLDLHTKEKP